MLSALLLLRSVRAALLDISNAHPELNNSPKGTVTLLTSQSPFIHNKNASDLDRPSEEDISPGDKAVFKPYGDKNADRLVFFFHILKFQNTEINIREANFF